MPNLKGNRYLVKNAKKKTRNARANKARSRRNKRSVKRDYTELKTTIVNFVILAVGVFIWWLIFGV